MNCVFAHDHILRKHNGTYYSTGGLSREALERYLEVFPKLTVLSRQIEIGHVPTNLSISSTKGVKFVSIPNLKTISGIFSYSKAKTIISKNVRDADFLIARLPSVIGSLSLKYAKKYNVPYVVEVVTCAWDSYWNHSFLGKIIAPLAYLKLRTQVYNSNHTIYVTDEFLQERYPTKGKSVGCSNVFLGSLENKVLQKRLEKIKNTSDKLIIGTIGSVDVKFKGQKYIIEALGRMKKQGCDKYQYRMLGAGDQAYLRKMAEKHNVEKQVFFDGTLPHDEVFKWLEKIDIYVQPSKQEGLPRALIEAMSQGVPSFGAKTAGIPELIDRNCVFSHFPITRTKKIMDILKSISNPKELEYQAIKNFDYAKNYTEEIIQTRRKNFILEAIEDQRSV